MTDPRNSDRPSENTDASGPLHNAHVLAWIFWRTGVTPLVDVDPWSAIERILDAAAIRGKRIRQADVHEAAEVLRAAFGLKLLGIDVRELYAERRKLIRTHGVAAIVAAYEASGQFVEAAKLALETMQLTKRQMLAYKMDLVLHERGGTLYNAAQQLGEETGEKLPDILAEYRLIRRRRAARQQTPT